MKKNDLKLVCVVLIIAVGIFCANKFLLQRDGAYAVAYVDSKLYGSYDLEEEQHILIENTNQFSIQEGKVNMVDANCPDKLCVHQKAIDKKGETIVCLPNKVVIEIQGNAEVNNLDGIVQ